MSARIVDDHEDHTARTTYHLLGAGGRRLVDLAPAGEVARKDHLHRLIGSSVHVDGIMLGTTMLLDDSATIESQAATNARSASPLPAALSATVSGEQSTLVILGNLRDQTVQCTASQIEEQLFDATGFSMNRAYSESSRGLVSMTGRAIGPFTIGFDSAGVCDPDAWAGALDAAARAAGIEPSNYQRISYALPRVGNCGWTGLGALGGPLPTPSWVLACENSGVFTHEIGHNLLFGHASSPTSEYGDYTDPMGAGGLVQFNAANRTMAGWVGDARVNDVGSGSHSLVALENAATGAAQVLRLAKPDTGEFYYVSLRKTIGIDTRLLSGFDNTISIHRALGAMPAKTVNVAVLAVGQEFRDDANGIRIAYQSVSGDVATVSVGIGGAACVPGVPSIAILPGSQSGGAGSELGYLVQVVNRDSATCGISTFALSQVLPAGFTGRFELASLSLAPGSTGTTTWTVVAPLAATNASHLIEATARSASAEPASASASLMIYNAPVCVRGTPSLALSPTSQSAPAGSRFVFGLSLHNTDSAACAPSSFALTQSLPTGFTGAPSAATLLVAPGSSASTSWIVDSGALMPEGNFPLQLTASASGGGTISAMAMATILPSTPIDATPPDVVITSPGAGAAISGRRVTVAASASDDGGITMVEFLVDGTLLARDSRAPFTASWTLRSVAAGPHRLTARATDLAGNRAEHTIEVNVR